MLIAGNVDSILSRRLFPQRFGGRHFVTCRLKISNCFLYYLPSLASQVQNAI